MTVVSVYTLENREGGKHLRGLIPDLEQVETRSWLEDIVAVLAISNFGSVPRKHTAIIYPV